MLLLTRGSLRFLARYPWTVSLSLLGVALGVAVVVAIDLTGRSAQGSFERSTDAIAGRATHQIVGGPGGVPEALYVELRRRGMRSIAPVVEGSVVAGGSPGRVMTLLGVDPLAEEEFRSYSPSGLGGRASLGDLLTGQPVALLAEPAARRLGVVAGDSLPVVAGARASELRVGGYLAGGDDVDAAAVESLLLVDVSLAQAILGLEGRLSRIDLRFEETATDAGSVDRLATLLAPGLSLERSASRSETAAELTAAFRINLQALSLLALLCGAFLIYNSVTFSVVRRRRLFATLRALGTTRRRILRMVLLEALAIGLVGSLVGLGLGVLLARGLVGLVARTVSDFYFDAGAARMDVEPWSLVAGLVLGGTAAALAGLRPAWEATTVSPRLAMQRSSLETQAHRAARYGAVAALLAVVLGGLILAVSRGVATSFVGVFTVLLGCTLATPLAALALTGALSRGLGRRAPMTARMAVRSVAANLSRTGVAMAALMMALAVAVGIGLMISSFRGTVERWLRTSLPADLYVTSAAAGARDAVPVSSLEEAWLREIEALPGIERVNALRRVRVGSSAGEIDLVALDMDERSHGAFALRESAGEDVWGAFHAGRAVLVSEPLAYRAGLGAGDTIELAVASGESQLPIAGVFYDYSTDRGYLLMDLGLYRRSWSDAGLTAASAFVEEGVDLAAAAESIRAALPVEAGLVVRSDAALRRASLRVFDRTFRITGVLRLLAIVVAMIGILGSLMALQLERARELGLLRASGLTRGQLWRMVTTQTGLMGLISGLMALPVGMAMAAMMIYVVNRRSFGWTMPMEIDLAILGQTLLVAVAAAILAGVVPSRRMAAVSPAEALREE